MILNGAMRFQPRSHLNTTSEPPREEDTFYAGLKAGDTLVTSTSCYRGGSKHKSTDEERTIYMHFINKGDQTGPKD